MADTLVAVLFVAVAGVLAVLALLLVTVAPFVVAVDRGQQRGASPARVGAAALAGCAVALALAVRTVESAGVAGVLALLLAWVVPVAVARAPQLPGLGRAERHG